MRMNLWAARFTHEGHVPEAEHVERSQQGRHEPDKPEGHSECSMQEGLVENCILREERGQGRKSSDRKHRCGHGPERDRQMLAQATHLAQILFAADRVNHRTCRKEEKSLEERVGNKVKDGCRVSRNPAA